MRRLPRRSLLAAAALLCSALGDASAPEALAHTIVIENMTYSPLTLTVRRGDRIVWVNKDLFAHTVTASQGAFDSGGINAGKSWSYVATKNGIYPYSCRFHPIMKGALKVE